MPDSPNLSAPPYGQFNAATGDLELTSKESAERLAVSLRTFYRYVADGRITSRVTPGGQHRFRLQDIDALLKQAS
jgi:excisionase family DNA binding protein